MVFQHFSLFDSLIVAENVWLGLDKALPLAEVSRRIEQVAQTYGLPLEPGRPVHTLSVGEMQRVEIIRALLAAPRLLILDEPTSVLTPQAVERLFETLRQLAAQGCSILYISHKLHEIRALYHACTVRKSLRKVSLIMQMSKGSQHPISQPYLKPAAKELQMIASMQLDLLKQS